MVIQGSNNVELIVSIIEKGKLLPLEGATVSLKIKVGARTIAKSSTIIGTGLVSVMLTSDDLSTFGDYYIQATVLYTDGRLFRSEPGKFPVGAAL